MQRILAVFFVACGIFSLTGCATSSPVNGAIYADVQGPVAVTSNPRGNLHGEACATGWLGLYATGDASISAAARNGHIGTISYVEQHTKTLVIYSTYCTEVWGFAARAGAANGPAPASVR